MSAVLLAQIATLVETNAGITTSANAGDPGYWKRIALAAESLAGLSTPANDSVPGWQFRAALAFDDLTGFNGSSYNYGEEGYLARIAAALESDIVATTVGSYEYRILQALLGGAGTGAPPPVFIQDNLTILPIFVVGGRPTKSVQTYCVRVKNAGGATKDAYDADDAENGFTPTKVVGFFNSVDGVFWSLLSDHDYVRVGNTIGAKNSTASAIVNPIPTAIKAQFTRGGAHPGCCAWLNYVGLPGSTSGAAVNLLLISAAGSSTTARDALIRCNATIEIECGARRTEGDAAVLQAHGRWIPEGPETPFHNADFSAGAVLRSGRYGAVTKTPAALGSSAATATVPLAANITIPAGATFFGTSLFNQFLDLTNERQFRFNSYQCFHDTATIGDGNQSWWGKNISCANPLSDYGMFGFTNRAGYQYMAEFTKSNGYLSDVKCFFDAPKVTQDDHDGIVGDYETNRAHCFTYSHHNVAAGGDINYRYWFSSTGRVRDLTLTQTFTPGSTTNIAQPNYGQLILQPDGTKAHFYTNDDNDVSWRPFYTNDITASPPVWTEGRRCFAQALAPGGGQNQAYGLFRNHDTDTNLIRVVANPHPTNVQNALYEMFIKWDDGKTVVGGVEGSGSVYDDPTLTRLRDITALTPLFTPALLRSCRLLTAKSYSGSKLVGYVDFVNLDYSDGKHYLLVGTTPKLIGTTGTSFYTSYFGGLEFVEGAAGLAIVRVRASCGELAKATTVDLGDNWTETLVASVSGSNKFLRPFPMFNAALGEERVTIAEAPLYTDFNVWRSFFRTFSLAA